MLNAVLLNFDVAQRNICKKKANNFPNLDSPECCNWRPITENMRNARNYTTTTTFSSDKVNSSFSWKVRWKVLHSNSFFHSFLSMNQPNQNSKLTMSHVHNKMKQKAIKLHFIFSKKSFKVNNIFESVMLKKKKCDSDGAITAAWQLVSLKWALVYRKRKVFQRFRIWKQEFFYALELAYRKFSYVLESGRKKKIFQCFKIRKEKIFPCFKIQKQKIFLRFKIQKTKLCS